MIPPADADRIGDIAEDELDRRESRIELAIKFLAVGAGGKCALPGLPSSRCTHDATDRNSVLP